MKTYCLVIDDDNQEEYFNANVRRVLETDGNEIIPLFIKPTSRKFMKPDHSGLDKSAIVNYCRKKLDAHNVSIVVSDYKIATRKDSFTGVDVMLDLIETHPHVYKILYSATIKDAIKQILSLLSLRSDTIDFDVDDIIGRLVKIAQINAFVSGKGYEQKVIKYIRNPEIKHKQHVINILKEAASDMTLKSCYPPFIGKTFKEIGMEVENSTPQGEEFHEELIFQAIAYLTTVNHE